MKHTWTSKSKKAHKKHTENRKICKLRNKQQLPNTSNKFTTNKNHTDCLCSEENLKHVNKTIKINKITKKVRFKQDSINHLNKANKTNKMNQESWFDYSNTTARTVKILQQNFDRCILETKKSRNLDSLNLQTENLKIGLIGSQNGSVLNEDKMDDGMDGVTGNRSLNSSLESQKSEEQSSSSKSGLKSTKSLYYDSISQNSQQHFQKNSINFETLNLSTPFPKKQLPPSDASKKNKRREINKLAEQLDSILQTPVTRAKSRNKLQIDELTTGFSSKL